jgi:hypothetical protein
MLILTGLLIFKMREVEHLLRVDTCLSRQSVTFPARQPAKLTLTAEFGQKQSFVGDVKGDTVVNVFEFKRYGIILAMVCSSAVILSLIWSVPYLYTAIGFAVWALGGHLITLDDELPGGWSNPDGSALFPWVELGIKAAILFALVGLAFLVPALRTFGA